MLRLQSVRLQSCALHPDRFGETALSSPLPNVAGCSCFYCCLAGDVAKRLPGSLFGLFPPWPACLAVPASSPVNSAHIGEGEKATGRRRSGFRSDGSRCRCRCRSGQTEVLRGKAGANLSWKGTKGGGWRASLELKLDLGRRTATAPLHPANVHAVIRESHFSVDSVSLLQRMFFPSLWI
jgi:hypothetical protein